jgi:hypothetical protein
MASTQVPILQRIAGQFVAFAHESLTVTNAVKQFTAATIISGAKYAQVAFISVEDADIRYTYDGTTPSATVGHLLTNGSSLILTGYTDITAFRAYRAGTVDSTLRCTYEA